MTPKDVGVEAPAPAVTGALVEGRWTVGRCWAATLPGFFGPVLVTEEEVANDYLLNGWQLTEMAPVPESERRSPQGSNPNRMSASQRGLKLYVCPECSLTKMDAAQMRVHDGDCGGKFEPVEYVPAEQLQVAVEALQLADLLADAVMDGLGESRLVQLAREFHTACAALGESQEEM